MDLKTENNALNSGFIANIGQLTNISKNKSSLAMPPKKFINNGKELAPEIGMRWVGNKSSTKIHVDFSYLEMKTLLSIIVSNTIENIELCKPQEGFLKIQEQEYSVYMYQHDKIEFLNLNTNEQKKPNTENPAEQSRCETPLVINDSKPLALDIGDFADLINGKRIAVYTGAGISAGVVPTLAELNKSMNLEPHNKESYLTFVNDCLKNPAEKLKIMTTFYEACMNGKATYAHETVAQVCELKGWSLLTENVDRLHQQTGMSPLGREFLSKFTEGRFFKY